MPPAGVPQSVGQPSNGIVRDGVRLRDSGEGYVRARPGESTRYGTPSLVGAVERAAASVHRTYAGGAPLRVGDISGPAGGRHPRHGSHRVGRDVDVIYYVTNLRGRSVRGRGWLAYDRFGVARETVAPEGTEPSNELFFFDDARNWHFVRTLVLDPGSHVQWIFCSRGVKARLLAYAIQHEPDPAAIFRAAWLLHQPSRGHPHHDHFHVRVACTAEERLDGCVNRGPIWPWLRTAAEKPAHVGRPDLDDDSLVDALLSDLPEEA